MAWISVHDTVFGPKLRDLHKTLNSNIPEALGILVVLWHWGRENADKDGNILNADEEDISRFLYGQCIGCKLDFDEVVKALIDTGWIDRQNGQLSLHDWSTWQDQWYKAKEKREADTKRKREARQRISENASSVLAHSPVSEEAPVEKPEGGKNPERDGKSEEKPRYPKDFENFWAVYPRKIGKGEAYKKYQARRKDGFSETELLTAAKNYAAECKKRKTEPEYIKHAKTFLSENTPFVDFLPKKSTEAASAVQQSDSQNPFAKYGGGSQ